MRWARSGENEIMNGVKKVGKKEKRKVKHEMAGMLSVKQKPKDRQEESH